MFRYLIVLVVLIVSAFAAPQFGFGYPGYGYGGFGHGGKIEKVKFSEIILTIMNFI